MLSGHGLKTSQQKLSLGNAFHCRTTNIRLVGHWPGSTLTLRVSLEKVWAQRDTAHKAH